MTNSPEKEGKIVGYAHKAENYFRICHVEYNLIKI